MIKKSDREEAWNATESSICDDRKVSEEWKEITKSHICWKCWVEEIK